VQTATSPRLYYGWIVVAVTALALLVSAGVRSAPGVFLVPLQQDTQWSIGVISFAVSIGLLVLGLTAPVGGWLIDRFGPRTLTVIALALISLSMAASAFIQTPWQLALLWGADRHPLDPARQRPRHPTDDGCRDAGAHGRDELCRHAWLRLADRPLRPT